VYFKSTICHVSEYLCRSIIFRRTVEMLKSKAEGGNVFLNSVCSDRKGKRIIKAHLNCEGIHL
jgi:hypothetical protein